VTLGIKCLTPRGLSVTIRPTAGAAGCTSYSIGQGLRFGAGSQIAASSDAQYRLFAVFRRALPYFRLMNDGRTLERDVGREANEAFIERCRLLADELPDRLRHEAFELLDSLALTMSALPRSVTYIPIAHGVQDPQMETAMARELPQILEASSEPDTFLACGELHGVPLTRQGIAQGKIESLRQLNALGYIPMRDTAIRAVANRSSALVECVLAFLRLHRQIRSGGTESKSGAAVVTVLDMVPQVVPLHSDSAYMNETLYRLGIEARTRHALERAATLAKGRHIVFLQGALHIYGVEGWAFRRQVPLSVAWPPSLDPGTGSSPARNATDPAS